MKLSRPTINDSKMLTVITAVAVISLAVNGYQSFRLPRPIVPLKPANLSVLSDEIEIADVRLASNAELTDLLLGLHQNVNYNSEQLELVIAHWRKRPLRWIRSN